MILKQMRVTSVTAMYAEYERISLANESRDQLVDVYVQLAETGRWVYRKTLHLFVALNREPTRAWVDASTAVVAAALLVNGHKPEWGVRPLVYAHRRLLTESDAKPEVPKVTVPFTDDYGRRTTLEANATLRARQDV